MKEKQMTKYFNTFKESTPMEDITRIEKNTRIDENGCIYYKNNPVGIVEKEYTGYGTEIMIYIIEGFNEDEQQGFYNVVEKEYPGYGRDMYIETVSSDDLNEWLLEK